MMTDSNEAGIACLLYYYGRKRKHIGKCKQIQTCGQVKVVIDIYIHKVLSMYT
jgi:hypothetical protein